MLKRDQVQPCVPPGRYVLQRSILAGPARLTDSSISLARRIAILVTLQLAQKILLLPFYLPPCLIRVSLYPMHPAHL